MNNQQIEQLNKDYNLNLPESLLKYVLSIDLQSDELIVKFDWRATKKTVEIWAYKLDEQNIRNDFMIIGNRSYYDVREDLIVVKFYLKKICK